MGSFQFISKEFGESKGWAFRTRKFHVHFQFVYNVDLSKQNKDIFLFGHSSSMLFIVQLITFMTFLLINPTNWFRASYYIHLPKSEDLQIGTHDSK